MGQWPEAGLSKAIIGAAFIQYLFYAGFYMFEGRRWEELHNKNTEANQEPNA